MGVGDGAGSGGTVPPGGGGGWRGAGQAAVLSGPSATTGLVRTSEPLCSHSPIYKVYGSLWGREGGPWPRPRRGPSFQIAAPGGEELPGIGGHPPGPCRRPARPPSDRRGRRSRYDRPGRRPLPHAGRRGRRGGGSSGRRAGPRGNRRRTETHPDHRPDGVPPGTARQLRAPAHEHERARRRPPGGGTGGQRRARIGAGPFPDPVNPARCTTTCTTSRPSAGCTMYCAASCGRAHSQ